MNVCKAGSLLRNSRENLEQCTLASPVTADDADYFSFLDLKRDIPQSPECLCSHRRRRQSIRRRTPRPIERAHTADDLISKRIVLDLSCTDLELLCYLLYP